ncbi:MAG: tRNA (cytidine(34)-2'-O)-methyltransferase [Methyloligellaceae bacterium]
MRLALYQPDIPQNTGTILRMAACLGFAVDIVGPAGFAFSDRALKRAGLDYLNEVDMTHHISFPAFRKNTLDGQDRRLVLLTTHADLTDWDFDFEPRDILLFGRESAGVPENIHDLAHARLRIPIRPGLRSLNIAVAAAMVAGEASRQLQRQADMS